MTLLILKLIGPINLTLLHLEFETAHRFIQILDYISSENSVIAISEIQKLPDVAFNGFHDIYLTSKIISITLNHFTKDEFTKLSKDLVKQNLFVALFDPDIEGVDYESIDETFAYCKENPKEDIAEFLSSKFSNSPDIGFDFFKELKLLKSTCDSFIAFFDQNIELINKTATNISDPFTIENTDQGPQQEGALEDAFFLTEPGDQKTIKNQGTLVIDHMIPCFAVLIIAENNNKEIACLGKHVFPVEYQYSNEDHQILFKDLHQLMNSLKSDGYAQSMRMYIVGGSMTSLSLILQLLMYQWSMGQDSTLPIRDIYLLPSFYGYLSHCIVNLFDGTCSIQVGGELYDEDQTLSQQGELIIHPAYFKEPPPLSKDSYLENALFLTPNLDPTEVALVGLSAACPQSLISTDDDAWINSSDRPIKRLKTEESAAIPDSANSGTNFFSSPPLNTPLFFSEIEKNTEDQEKEDQTKNLN